MELKQFVKSVLKDIVGAVEETRDESSRDMYLKSGKEERTIEFDIAVTVEDVISGSGKTGIKVFSVIEGGGEISKEAKNSSVSRIKFGVYVNTMTKEENAEYDREISRQFRNSNNRT